MTDIGTLLGLAFWIWVVWALVPKKDEKKSPQQHDDWTQHGAGTIDSSR